MVLISQQCLFLCLDQVPFVTQPCAICTESREDTEIEENLMILKQKQNMIFERHEMIHDLFMVTSVDANQCVTALSNIWMLLQSREYLWHKMLNRKVCLCKVMSLLPLRWT